MRVAVVGLGAVGARAARQLTVSPQVAEVRLHDVAAGRAAQVAASLAGTARGMSGAFPIEPCDVVVLAMPAPHGPAARSALALGAHVVSTSDDLRDTRELLDLGKDAERSERTVLVGAAFAPGLSCLLARFAASGMDEVDEVHVARHGTGGPACARQHHRVLSSTAVIWRDGRWMERSGGSGRELLWFPEPVGARDCYHAQLVDPSVLLPAFPDAQRLSARISATRRDRLTARLPMLRPPHPEGGLGAVRVEVRGQRQSARVVEILGAVDRPAVAAGGVAALAAIAAPTAPRGAYGLADRRLDTVALLTELYRRGIRAARFVGAGD